MKTNPYQRSYKADESGRVSRRSKDGFVSVLSQEGIQRAIKKAIAAPNLNNLHRRDRSSRARNSSKKETVRGIDQERSQQREIFSQGELEHPRGQSTNKKVGASARMFSPIQSKPPATTSIVLRNKNFIKSNIRRAGQSKDKLQKQNTLGQTQISQNQETHKRYQTKRRAKDIALTSGTTGGTEMPSATHSQRTLH